MGIDNLMLASFNPCGEKLNALPPRDRSLYLSETLEAADTDICFLPGDDKNTGMFAVSGYKQFLAPGASGSVLLYKSDRMHMKQQNVELGAFCHLAGLDYTKLIVPYVEIFSPLPHQTIVKEFSIVAWGYDLFQNSSVRPETLVESLVAFSQNIAIATKKPVIICGEIKVRYDNLVKIVKKMSTDAQEKFLSANNPIMADYGYLPSMTKASLKEIRHLFMMKVIKCKSDEFQQTNGTDSRVVADCFIASKALNLCDASLVNVEKVSCLFSRIVCVV